ncbi:LacI family transcriptional regulator [Victivallis vadensis]|uniref:LacI family transcriptional regulator n=1 Tax=Victivallis vadensis TaxID=172901 RepID=A0A848AV22_9BACT|nr:LacI family DNA-binding transcriptional regulator [Victivallis vadensis]NMD85957.1 LacI family transcriptional regulator [Victivallis vadensis]
MNHQKTLAFANMGELADYLGVSKVSVSLALRNSPEISPKLREQVQSVARKAGFSPRGYRRKSDEKMQSRENIAVLFDPEWKNDPVIQEISNHVVRRLAELHLPFELVQSTSLSEREYPLESFTGVIFDFSTAVEVLPRFAHLPQVAIMHEKLECGPWDSYKPDERLAGKLAADYLLRQGIRRWLLVWERIWTYQPEEHSRLEGFRQRARQAGVQLRELGYDHRQPTSQLAETFLKMLSDSDEPVGIFAFCDQIAYQLCMILDLAGRKRMPGRLEVVSCDNTALTRSLHPHLPVVDLHIAEIATCAVDGLAWRLRHPAALPREVRLYPELVVPSSGVN